LYIITAPRTGEALAMLEIEQKFARADFAAVERRLKEWGAEPAEEHNEADHYFNAPDRDFARTDEALRLRQVGSSNFVTYKGPKRGTQTKTRTEIEVPLGDGEQVAQDFARVLTHLGFRFVAVVRKQRRLYRLEREGFAVEVCLDEADGLGRFAEVEIRAPEEQLEPARAVLLRTAAALGLAGEERRSYLELLLNRQAGERKS
jgi:adenylate cyclase class 2